jgi:hypothetical protein
LFVLVISMVFIGADLTVSAQNANSSTTAEEDTSMQNSNTSNTNMNRGGRRRRGRRRGGNMNTADTTTTATSPTTPPVPAGRCDPSVQEQTDLSGTYTGTANYAEGGLSGETTLTISGNNFTMTSGSTTQEGRVVAVTTCNYTAVTMMFGKEQVSATAGAQPPPLPAVSLRAKKVGRGLMLESVGGETRQFSFSPSRSGSGGGGGHNMNAIPVGIKPPTARAHAH